MALAKITSVTGRAVNVPGNDIDTDRIIPARFMKCVTFDGLGEFVFFDVRHDPQGNKIAHPIDKPEHKGATFTGAAADSREVKPGRLFFALPGERVDGFDFCAAAAFAARRSA